MQEILKPLLDNNVLTTDVKETIGKVLTEAVTVRENAVRKEVEELARINFKSAKAKFEDTFKTLESSYKVKLDEAKTEINELEIQVEEMGALPFIDLTEEQLENAEATLIRDLEEKHNISEGIDHERYNATFEMIQDANAEVITILEEALESKQLVENTLIEKINVLESRLIDSDDIESVNETKVYEAIVETEQRMRDESEERLEELKTNLVTSTEIFLEQELAEVKRDKDLIMQETQGRELLASIKELVKQHWDVEAEVAEEVLELKKITESKVEQYKDMLKREHNRLEESQDEVELLRKKVIVESKGSVLTDDKKEVLEKLAANIGSDKLESQIDTLMETVIDNFNDGFITNTSGVLNESDDLFDDSDSITSMFSSGDTGKDENPSLELAELLDFAGVKK